MVDHENVRSHMTRISTWLATSAVSLAAALPLPALGQDASRESPRADTSHVVAVLQDFSAGLSHVHARNPAVKLRIDGHPAIPNERILMVDYPAPSDDPAARDVWLDVEQRDWTPGRAITFQAKPDRPTRLSISFADRNHVAFTTWIDLRDTTWQTIRVDFDTIRPNPFFQPGGATRDKPIDVSEVNGLGFAPQDRAAGRVAIGKIVLAR